MGYNKVFGKFRSPFIMLLPIIYLTNSYLAYLLAIIVLYIYRRGPAKIFFLLRKTLYRDMIAGKRLGTLNIFTTWYQYNDDSVISLFRKQVKKFPKKICIQDYNQKLTFEEVDEMTNQIANYFYRINYKKEDVVAIIMSNRVEYVLLYLGLAKIGVISSLVNVNLTKEPLQHTLNISKARAIIYEDKFEDIVQNIELTKFILTEDNNHSNNIMELIGDESKLANWPKTLKIHYEDKLLYIFTSGTTGLPKAAVTKHYRAIFGGVGANKVLRLTSNDTIYICLPLYHALGNLIGLCSTFCYGATSVIAPKFSVSAFWNDCIKFNCTTCLYIGEITRYLLQRDNGEVEKRQKIKNCIGNGMSKMFWNEFKNRFNIENIYEFYGAVGFTSLLVPDLLPVKIIRNEKDNPLEPIRDAITGLCIEAEPDEPGLLVGKITNGSPVRRFDGYVDNKATKRKILRNVLEEDDAYFSSGDILYHDREGFFYFVDRTGDTFRWKGENVSTKEIEIQISQIIRNDCIVFGVEVPNNEGRCGMVVLVEEEGREMDLDHLLKSMKESIASYAIPRFIRLVSTIKKTATYKYQKKDYQQESYKHFSNGKIYYLWNKKEYRKLTQESFEELEKISF
ncbi:hypothetical protein SNEBB_010370 [Seison nebaliae]|nr:hypothetical protein SNEBB_010370 [Seison nebaliae]